MSSACNPLVHLELHTGDLAAARAYYAALCGRRSERLRVGERSYLALELAAAVSGGIVECPVGRPVWLPYVQVGHIHSATERALACGAEVVVGAREGPAGWRTVIAAPVAGELALWQPKRRR